MSVFLSKIQDMQYQLKQMGEEISGEYKHLISAWESAPDDKQTLDNLVETLLMKEEKKGLKRRTPAKFIVVCFCVKEVRVWKLFQVRESGTLPERVCKSYKEL
ncbi:hypothetical protein EVAR_35704_1 [Eumeta japonica]|uniref:Uncharacterized protein n=1 Tax=Eumeta variegata TaxID=151549 RepID=A0A4C1VEH8_EUMVA|nr:hypothetical protein EVAR_35704_1 [Eumeta japonica]